MHGRIYTCVYRFASVCFQGGSKRQPRRLPGSARTRYWYRGCKDHGVCKDEAQPLTPTNAAQAQSPDRTARLVASMEVRSKGSGRGDGKGVDRQAGDGKSFGAFRHSRDSGKSACLLQEDDAAGTGHECCCKPFVLARAPHPAVRRPRHRRWQSKGMFVLDCISMSAGRAGCVQGGRCR